MTRIEATPDGDKRTAEQRSFVAIRRKAHRVHAMKLDWNVNPLLIFIIV
ncbi:hypothetical protein [Lactococcus protaetiae]|nr:hypothetical protein [Lactococcus protaetiae]